MGEKNRKKKGGGSDGGVWGGVGWQSASRNRLKCKKREKNKTKQTYVVWSRVNPGIESSYVAIKLIRANIDHCCVDE